MTTTQTDSQRIDDALAHYILVRDSHPYHVARRAAIPPNLQDTGIRQSLRQSGNGEKS